MSLSEMVRKGDPDRYAATIAASDAARAKLWPLYAFNLEIARAPWVTSEPLIAQMRLQFWHDVLDDISAGRPARAHEVAQPLAQVWREADLPVDLGHQMIEARMWDIARDPLPDAAAFERHIDQSAGHLMWLAAKALGAQAGAQPVVRDMGYASGLAHWLAAVPALQRAGRAPLPDTQPEALRALAQGGLARLKRARQCRAKVAPAAAPALLAGWQASAILTRAAQDPARIAAGALCPPEVQRRGALAWRMLTGRW